MLTIYPLQSGVSASKYYESVDYYIGGELLQNKWFGKGADELGLINEINFADFKNILQGILPDGSQLPAGTTGKRLAGYDLTFSAPKSLSILALIAGDKRLLKAHEDAVEEILQHIEKNVLQTRVKQSGITTQHKTGNLVASLHTHTDSRELDPNLHTHCVILNVTKYLDKWRAIYGSDLCYLKMELGFRYRNILAQKVLSLGYEIEVTSDKGTFELKAVAVELRKKFSKRREQIENKLQDLEVNSANKALNSSMANFLTRKQKKSITLEDAKLFWETQLSSSSYSLAELQQIVVDATERGPIKPKDKLTLANEVISEAITLESAKMSVFSIYNTLSTATKLSVGEIIPQNFLSAALEKAIEKKTIVNMGDDWLTTPQAMQEEQGIIQKMATHKQSFRLSGFMHKIVAKLYFSKSENRELASNILATKDRFTILNYASQEDLNKFMPIFDLMLKNVGFTHHLHFTKKQVDNFRLATGIKGKNLFGILKYLQNNPRMTNATNIWIIYQSQRIDSQLQSKIIDQAVQSDAKVIFVNAPYKDLSVGRGRPMSYLQHAKSCASYTLKEEPQLVAEVIEQQFNSVKFTELSCSKERRQVAINWLLEQNLMNSAIYVSNNNEKDLINTQVQQQLLAKGKLGAYIESPKLQEIYLNGRQKTAVASYILGDIIAFTRGEKKNTYWTISNIDQLRQRLVLTNEQSIDSLSLKSKDNVASFKVYRETKVHIYANEILVWQQKTANLARGERVLVVSVQKDSYILQTQAGKQFTLHPTLENAHFSHAYALIINQDDWTETGAMLLSSKQYCPWIKFNSAKQTIVFTDDKEKLKQALLSNLGFKPDAYNASPVAFVAPQSLNLSNVNIQQLNDYLSQKQYLSVNKDQADVTSTAAIANDLQQPSIANVPVKQLSQHLDEAKNLAALEDLQVGGELYAACQRFDYALQVVSEKEAVFMCHDFKKYAMAINISEENFNLAFDLYMESGIIQTIGNYLTTAEILGMEQTCVDLMQAHKKSVPAILEPNHPALAEIQANSFLTQGQKSAVIDSLSTQDRFTAIHGAPGVGKTALLKELKRHGRDAGFDFIGITNTAAARNNLSDKTADSQKSKLVNAGIEAKTVAAFLFQAQKDLPELKAEFKNKIILVDEASMLGLRDLSSLMQIAVKFESRIIFLGDVKQLPAIEASKGFHLLLVKGMEFSLVFTNVRLKNQQALTVLKELYAEKITQAFVSLEKNIFEIKDSDQRLAKMAETYMQQMGKLDVMAVFSFNKDRKAFNALIRQESKARGMLTGAEIETPILVAKDVADVAKNNPFSYARGDLVLFHFSISRLGIVKENYYQVASSQDSKVILQIDNKEINLDLSQYDLSQGRVEIFTKENILLMAGDLICWRKNNASEGLVNSYIAYIVSIKPGEMVINDEFKLNRTINLNEEKFTHFDHAYGATVHRVQGLDSTLVLGHSQSCVADEDQQKFYHPINNLNSFLVMASRGDYFDFFVDDKKKYMQAILQNCNVKLSALEISMGDEWDKLNCAFKEKIKQVTGLHDVPVTEDPVAIKAAPTAEIVLLKQELQREFKRSPARPPATRYDVEMIKQRLNQDVVSFVASYLGSPILRNNKMAMWALGNNKKKANLSVEISGYKIGYWCDHRIPTGGKDLISFYTHFNKVDYKTALKELSNEYGINKQLNIHTTSVKTSLQSDLEEQTKKINQANKTYQNSSSTKGTLAEKYLREQRGIQGELPNDFRFHPSLYHYIEEKNFPALIIPARDQQGKIIALNRIFLNSDGSKIAGFAKLTQGVAKNATIDINLGGKLGKTYISEGTENALTIKDAKPEYDIKACLSIGNLGGICFRPGTHTVVIVADNDLNNPSTKQALIKAVASFQNQGLNVELALPKSIDIKLDLNDVYKSSGLAATLKILDNTVKVSNITQLGDKYEPLQTSFTRIEKDSLNLNHRQIEHER